MCGGGAKGVVAHGCLFSMSQTGRRKGRRVRQQGAGRQAGMCLCACVSHPSSRGTRGSCLTDPSVCVQPAKLPQPKVQARTQRLFTLWRDRGSERSDVAVRRRKAYVRGMRVRCVGKRRFSSNEMFSATENHGVKSAWTTIYRVSHVCRFMRWSAAAKCAYDIVYATRARKCKCCAYA